VTLFEKAVYTVAALIGLLLVGIVGAYWWTSRVPSRPASVRADAVFLWAPAVGVPAPRRGDWIACWEESGRAFCELSDINGSVEYKGEFLPYAPKGTESGADIRVDPAKTRQNSVWIGDALVPLVCLENGSILIPAVKYEEGSRLLEHRQENH
jgi:hypothetical protein